MDCPIKKVAVVERWLLWRGGRCGGSTVSNSQVSVGYKAITFLQPVHNILWPSFANKGRRGGGVGRNAEEKGREGNSLHAWYKRKGKEREGKAQNEKSLEDFLSPQSSLHFPSFSPPQFNASDTGKESACYKSLCFCIPPTNFPTLNLITSTLNT